MRLWRNSQNRRTKKEKLPPARALVQSARFLSDKGIEKAVPLIQGKRRKNVQHTKRIVYSNENASKGAASTTRYQLHNFLIHRGFDTYSLTSPTRRARRASMAGDGKLHLDTHDSAVSTELGQAAGYADLELKTGQPGDGNHMM